MHIYLFIYLVSSDELSFKEDMLISHIGEEWLRGYLLNGSEGIFPKSFVEVVVSYH